MLIDDSTHFVKWWQLRASADYAHDFDRLSTTTGQFLLGRNQISLVVTEPAMASSDPATGLVGIADTTPPNIVGFSTEARTNWDQESNWAQGGIFLAYAFAFFHAAHDLGVLEDI